ncbi:hypothetical protein [Aquibium sp. ELW1220]|uniref:hypothetical protein n=1 Tax=Aquibium sp. ELW1220 TaxID=2976766 RepID=UPI0025AFADD3|nr:hypothetical protein [Aquibium sp. ELW1220]MDN2580957.1 hypothetical protein [Aquibium sp. ELW1220]
MELFAQKVGHKARVSFLERDRQYTADLLERRRLPVLEEADERLDRRQANVARYGRVFALVLKMLKEGADEPGIDRPGQIEAPSSGLRHRGRKA